MIDIFSILLTHGLILLVCWRLLFREDLDIDDPAAAKPVRPWLKGGAEDAAADGAADA